VTGAEPERARRTTWVDTAGTTWRVEPVAGRWQLSRYMPASETWQRVGSFPNRQAAIRAVHEQGEQS
jgi:hypothetical protein